MHMAFFFCLGLLTLGNVHLFVLMTVTVYMRLCFKCVCVLIIACVFLCEIRGGVLTVAVD